jgi:hypothetical protein
LIELANYAPRPKEHKDNPNVGLMKVYKPEPMFVVTADRDYEPG